MNEQSDDQAVFEHLTKAGALYERYLEVAQISQIPSEEEMRLVAVQAPPTLYLPLQFEIRTER